MKHMRSTRKMIADPTLWAGLNRPGISLTDADVVVCGIPFDGGTSFRPGAAEAPSTLRDITWSICPTTEDFELFDIKVLDEGDIDDELDRARLFVRVEEKAAEYVCAGKFFTFIGGDHSVTIPIHRGIDRAIDKEFGIVHIDAHFDLCDEIGGDTLSHGATERRALELNHVAGLDNIFFVGIRSAESCEVDFLHDKSPNVIGARELRRIGTELALDRIFEKMARFEALYITIDIDSLDPAYAPGTGTPQFGGLDSRELLELLRGLMELPVIGFDVVEVAPPLDPSDITLFAARKIVTECWGHWWRKNKK